MMHCFACKQTCSSVDDAHCNRGVGGDYFRYMLIANRQDVLRYRCVLSQTATKDDVLRWMFVVDCKQTGCSSV